MLVQAGGAIIISLHGDPPQLHELPNPRHYDGGSGTRGEDPLFRSIVRRAVVTKSWHKMFLLQAWLNVDALENKIKKPKKKTEKRTNVSLSYLDFCSDLQSSSPKRVFP